MNARILTVAMMLVVVAAQAQKATMIIHNANIVTLDDARPTAHAVAVVNDRIVAVGNDKEILARKSKGTKVIDAHGRTLIPGLYDSHLHVIRAGRFYNTELRWDGVTSLARALDMLREQAARTPQGQWVRVVGGWNEYQFQEKRLPTLDEINAAIGNTPAFVLYLYSHAYLNKAALKTLNIDGNTPNPPGGLIQKDADGRPTGLLIAEPNAFILYSTLAKLPELNATEKLNSTRLYMNELNRLGVTSVMDAGGGFQNYPDDYEITDSLDALGHLTVRIPYYLFAQKAGTELQDYQRWTSMVDIDHQHEDGPITYHVQGGGENLIASGADFENFTKPRPQLVPAMEKQLTEVLTVLVKKRWPFRLHATYNESIGRFLDVIEAVNKEYPINGLPWFFDHAETVTEENLKRIKALGGGIAIQDRMAFQGETFVARYGKTAALDAPPLGKMLDLGIKVGLGTDGTRVSSYNPWLSLYWLTTGKTIGGKELLGKENRLDRTRALKLLTQGSASLINQDTDRGAIKAGYLADMALLSEDYFTVNEETIRNIHSVITVLGGKVVYGGQEFKTVAPQMPAAIPEWSPVNFYGGYQYK